MIINFIFQAAIGSGIIFLIIYSLMALGSFSKKIKKALVDIEKQKNNSHRILNDIEKIKQSIKKIDPSIYDSYWNDNKKY